MKITDFQYQALSVRNRGDGVATLVHTRLDQTTRKVVVTEVAQLLGDAADPIDAAQLLVTGARLYQQMITEYLATQK